MRREWRLLLWLTSGLVAFGIVALIAVAVIVATR
jgi:hypothetical protein